MSGATYSVTVETPALTRADPEGESGVRATAETRIYDAGGHFVLCAPSKRPIWREWNRQRPPASLAEPLGLVQHQHPHPQVDGQPGRRVRQHQPAPDVQAGAGLGVPAVVPQPDLDARPERQPAGERVVPRALQDDLDATEILTPRDSRGDRRALVCDYAQRDEALKRGDTARADELDRDPQVRQGRAAWMHARTGQHNDRTVLAREIDERNDAREQERAALRDELRTIQQQIEQLSRIHPARRRSRRRRHLDAGARFPWPPLTDNETTLRPAGRSGPAVRPDGTPSRHADGYAGRGGGV